MHCIGGWEWARSKPRHSQQIDMTGLLCGVINGMFFFPSLISASFILRA